MKWLRAGAGAIALGLLVGLVAAAAVIGALTAGVGP